jgi:hypothetical protein
MNYIKDDGGRCTEYNIPMLKKNLVGDCVIRAIAIALNQKYKQTSNELHELSMERGGVPNDQSIYEEYLFSKGWIKNKPPRDCYGKKIRLRYWNSQLAIVTTTLHLTAIVDNTVRDTFDTRGWCCNSYYTPSEQIKPKKVKVKSNRNTYYISENQKVMTRNIETFQTEIEKFKYGNKSAGTRSRKALMEIIKVSKQLRKEIQEAKTPKT